MFSWPVLLISFATIVSLWAVGSLLERLYGRARPQPSVDNVTSSVPPLVPLHLGGGWMLAHGLVVLDYGDCTSGPMQAAIMHSPNGRHRFIAVRKTSTWDRICLTGSHPN